MLVAVAILFTACNEEDSNIGMGLQDPATLFDGKRDTVYDLTAYTFYDDSLRTGGYSGAVIGSYHDAVMGNVTASYYTQISNKDGIELDEHCVIDSAILSLVLTDLYPYESGSCNLHFQIDQLQEALHKDTTYYVFDSIAVGSNRFFEGEVTVECRDTMTVKLPLNDNFGAQLLNTSLSATELTDHLKGLRIAMHANGTSRLATINLAAVQTKITLYYRYIDGDNINSVRTLDLHIGMSSTHFSRYIHDYSGSSLATFANPKDSIAGTQRLYLEPLGGTYIRINMKEWLDHFRTQHPYATINYAVLKFPVAEDRTDTLYPSRLYAYKRYADGTSITVPDLTDGITYGRYDGSNNFDKRYYRIRLTQHVQKMLLSGNDFGTDIYLEGRRTSSRRVILNGTEATDRPRLEIVYSE